MKIALFNNKKGLIYGGDPKRISCDKEGTLHVGATTINLTPGKDEIMPLLFHGATGSYNATFTDATGDNYALEKLTIQAGRIVAPSQLVADIMELRCELDRANDKMDLIMAKITELDQVFDTDSLNFLIK